MPLKKEIEASLVGNKLRREDLTGHHKIEETAWPIS
jgi:hypothetical protein